MTDNDSASTRKHSVRLELDPDDWKLLMEVADAERLTRSDIMRRALRTYAPGAIREARKKFQALQRVLEDDEQASA